MVRLCDFVVVFFYLNRRSVQSLIKIDYRIHLMLWWYI